MAYQNKPGYFQVHESGRIIAYQDLALLNSATAEAVISTDQIKQIANGCTKPRLLCLCHPLEPIMMHFQRVRIGDVTARFWDNAANHLTHTVDCPRAKSSDVKQGRERRSTLPGVEWEMNADGQVIVDVNMDPFAIEEEATEISVDVKSCATQEQKQGGALRARNVIASRSSSGTRRKSKYEGLIRVWYELGRMYAAKEAYTQDKQKIASKNLSLQNLLWGMWRVMLNTKPDDPFQFSVAGKKASLFAYIPSKQAEHKRRVGEQKIIVGRVKKAWLKNNEIHISLDGINTSWDVITSRSGFPSNVVHRLAALRCEFGEDGFYRTTHKPVFVSIAEPGAVWVDSAYEMQVYHELRVRNFTIEKPMRETDEFFQYRPDFVLRDFRQPVVIEIYGMRGNKAYNEHKEYKRKVYTAAMNHGLLQYIEWDVTSKNAWQHFVDELNRLNM